MNTGTPFSQRRKLKRQSSISLDMIQAKPQSSNVCTLRVISVNDVRKLSNFARLSTLIKQERTPNTVTALAGSFLAPSLLASIDKGRAMIATMNLAPISHVCFGNAEAYHGVEELVARIKEFDGVWLNTNMQSFKGADMPAYDVVEVVNGSHRRKVI